MNKKIEGVFCFKTPFLKMILNESQTIWLKNNIGTKINLELN